MPRRELTDAELLAWLDEQLPVADMAAVEQEMRDSEPLRRRAAWLIQQRDQGNHSVGAIWRRQRLSCPGRSELGSWLLGTLEPGLANYLEFHLHVAGCRFCTANLEDLEEAFAQTPETARRQRKYFESSASLLPAEE